MLCWRKRRSAVPALGTAQTLFIITIMEMLSTATVRYDLQKTVKVIGDGVIR